MQKHHSAKQSNVCMFIQSLLILNLSHDHVALNLTQHSPSAGWMSDCCESDVRLFELIIKISHEFII